MLLPKVKEAENFMRLFGREYLTFDVSLQRTQVLLLGRFFTKPLPIVDCGSVALLNITFPRLALQ